MDLDVKSVKVPEEFTLRMPVEGNRRRNVVVVRDRPSPLDLPKQKDRCVHVEATSIPDEDNAVLDGDEVGQRTFYQRCYNSAFGGWLCPHHQERLLEDFRADAIRKLGIVNERAETEGLIERIKREVRNANVTILEDGTLGSADLVGLDYSKYTNWGWWKEETPAPSFNRAEPVEVE